MGVVVWGGFFITTPPSALGRNSSERADANDPCCSIRRPSNLSSPNAKDNYYESSSLYSPNSSTFKHEICEHYSIAPGNPRSWLRSKISGRTTTFSLTGPYQTILKASQQSKYIILSSFIIRLVVYLKSRISQ